MTYYVSSGTFNSAHSLTRPYSLMFQTGLSTAAEASSSALMMMTL